MPFDLSDNSGADQPVSGPATAPGPGQPQPPSRASDMLRPGGPRAAAGALPMSNSLPFIVCDRPITPADGAIKSITALLSVAIVLGVAYLLFALWSGSAANPAFRGLSADDQLRIVGNLGKISHIVSICAWTAVIAGVFLYYDIAATGYILVAIAAAFSFGVPLLTPLVFTLEHSTASSATTFLQTFFGGLGWAPGLLGVLLLVLEAVRRFLFHLQEAKVKRSKLRFGQNVAVHAKRRNVFLGACWNMPYCREAIREKCPVHIARKGPCWRHKRGCMCEESIAVLATSAGDWKSKVAGAVDKIEGRGAPAPAGAAPARSTNPLLAFSDGSGRPTLSDVEKAQRCRECVIYNTHQEQKYKALVATVFAGGALLLYFVHGSLLTVMAAFYTHMNMAMHQFSLNGGGATAEGGGALPLSTSTAGPVSWFIIAVAMILILSKLLQLVEYCCFKIKI